MENQKTCADCINIGREVYCMKCKRLNNGYQDMFTEQSKSEYINIQYQNRVGRNSSALSHHRTRRSAYGGSI